MGTFATTTSFSDLLVDSNLDTATTALLSKKIDLAENTVKSRISKRYDVSAFGTATAVPPQLTDLTELLTEGFYYKSQSRGNEKMLKRGMTLCKMALDELELLMNGDVNLLNTAGSSIVESENGAWGMTSSTIDYTNTFNVDNPKNWKVDPDRLDDIADDRD